MDRGLGILKNPPSTGGFQKWWWIPKNLNMLLSF